MRSVPESMSMPGQPRLSNRLADLAERAGEAAKRYRRGSIESIRAYLDAGELLVEARGECRRGEWGAFLVRADIDKRAAQRMMQSWRIARESGADAEAIHEAGGVRVFVERALADMPAALHGAADGLEDGDGEAEKSVLGSRFSAPMGIAEPPSPAYRRDGEASTSVAASQSVPTPSSSPEPPDTLSPAQRRARRRSARREAGLCLDCGAECGDGRVRCPPCRSRIATADARRRENARVGGELAPRLREAAKRGHGVRLSAADVAGLMAAGRRGRR